MCDSDSSSICISIFVFVFFLTFFCLILIAGMMYFLFLKKNNNNKKLEMLGSIVSHLGSVNPQHVCSLYNLSLLVFNPNLLLSYHK